MFGIGLSELIVILVLALIILGPQRIPDLARSLGNGVAQLRRMGEDLRGSLQEEFDQDSESAQNKSQTIYGPRPSQSKQEERETPPPSGKPS
jgi:Tat protein translocase TatB subunit